MSLGLVVLEEKLFTQTLTPQSDAIISADIEKDEYRFSTLGKINWSKQSKFRCYLRGVSRCWLSLYAEWIWFWCTRWQRGCGADGCLVGTHCPSGSLAASVWAPDHSDLLVFLHDCSEGTHFHWYHRSYPHFWRSEGSFCWAVKKEIQI